MAITFSDPAVSELAAEADTISLGLTWNIPLDMPATLAHVMALGGQKPLHSSRALQ